MPGQRVGEQQRCCVQSAWRTAGGRCGHCVCGLAAGQCERACELRRAERELCWREQRGEQRRDERDCRFCGWRRAWHERLLCESERWRERLRCQRVAQRQRCAVPQVQRVARRGWDGGVVRSAAGQLERSCELRRAERERCWREQQQRGEQRGCERDCCWKRRLWSERGQRCWSSRGQRVGRERVAQRQRACLPGWCWIRRRGPDA